MEPLTTKFPAGSGPTGGPALTCSSEPSEPSKPQAASNATQQKAVLLIAVLEVQGACRHETTFADRNFLKISALVLRTTIDAVPPAGSVWTARGGESFWLAWQAPVRPAGRRN
jgi:hypothetical protein